MLHICHVVSSFKWQCSFCVGCATSQGNPTTVSASPLGFRSHEVEEDPERSREPDFAAQLPIDLACAPPSSPPHSLGCRSSGLTPLMPSVPEVWSIEAEASQISSSAASALARQGPRSLGAVPKVGGDFQISDKVGPTLRALGAPEPLKLTSRSCLAASWRVTGH